MHGWLKIEAGRSTDPQFLHATPERTGVEAKSSCSAIRTVDPPLGLLQHTSDMLALDVLKVARRRYLRHECRRDEELVVDIDDRRA